MPKFPLRLCIALCILFSIAACARVRAEETNVDVYLKALQDGVDSGVFNQIAAGWIDGDRRSTWFLGKSDKPDINARFEIGSLTEIFTGLLFAQSAIEGKIGQHATLRDALPNSASLAPNFASISLTSLATRQSGLPAVPANLFPMTLDDAYADYTDADVRAFLANDRQPLDVLGAHYTPLDMGLLGYAIAQRESTNFQHLLTERVLEPLSMSHSSFDDAALVSGHSRGRPVAHWHFGALAGAAGMRSSTGDLLDFLQANLRPNGSSLRNALLLARQPRADDANQTGLGWNIATVESDGQSWPLVWRASTTAGFAAFVAFRTDLQRALVLLGNSDADVSRIGLAWMRGEAQASTPAFVSARPSNIDLKIYAGLYDVDGQELVVRAHDAEITAQFKGMPAIALRPIDDDVFVAHGESMMLSFQRELGKVTNVVIEHGGVNVLANRLSKQAPRLDRKVMAVSSAKLSEYIGDFKLDVATRARVSVDGGGLLFHLTGQESTPLAAFAIDRFADVDDSCEVSFKRDRAGKVTGFVVSLAGVDREATRDPWTVAP